MNRQPWHSKSFAFRDHARGLPSDAVEELRLLARIDAASSPSPAPRAAEMFVDSVMPLVAASPGYAVITGLDRLPERDWKFAFETLSGLFGEAIPQAADGTLIRLVRDRGTSIGEGATARYSDSRFGGSLHTDGAQLPLPVPDFFSLLCVRQADTGGDFVMVDGLNLLAKLDRSDGAVRTVLSSTFAFDTRRPAPDGSVSVVEKPVLFSKPDGTRGITYFREYIESGQCADGYGGVSSEQRRALDTVDGILADSSGQVVGRLQPGEMIVVDNHRVIHGRTTFVDGDVEEGRLLYRMWLRRRRVDA